MLSKEIIGVDWRGEKAYGRWNGTVLCCLGIGTPGWNILFRSTIEAVVRGCHSIIWAEGRLRTGWTHSAARARVIATGRLARWVGTAILAMSDPEVSVLGLVLDSIDCLSGI